jgi:phosphoserine aminotransferase
MNQIFNFSASPSTLPSPVLNKIQRDLFEFGNAKASAIEISHRGVDFMALAKKAEQDLET